MCFSLTLTSFIVCLMYYHVSFLRSYILNFQFENLDSVAVYDYNILQCIENDQFKHIWTALPKDNIRSIRESLINNISKVICSLGIVKHLKLTPCY